MKVFLDFDDTLFNTKAFIEDFSGVFSDQGVSDELYRTTRRDAYRYYDATTSVYDIDEHVRILKEKIPDFDSVQAKKSVDRFLADTSKYVFADVIPFLDALQKNGIECFILSFGQEVFQRTKIAGTGLTPFFKEVMIVQSEKYRAIAAVVHDKEEKVWFVDDRAEYIDEVKVKLPWVRSVQITRVDGRYHDALSEKSDFLIQSFNDIVKEFS